MGQTTGSVHVSGGGTLFSGATASAKGNTHTPETGEIFIAGTSGSKICAFDPAVPQTLIMAAAVVNVQDYAIGVLESATARMLAAGVIAARSVGGWAPDAPYF